MLEEIDALPRAEHQVAFLHWHGQVCLGEGGANMGGHVIGAFRRVPIEAVIFGYGAAKKII